MRKRLEAVRVNLLGGFRVSLGARVVEEGEWQLRKAASLVKLLSCQNTVSIGSRRWISSGRVAGDKLPRTTCARRYTSPDGHWSPTRLPLSRPSSLLQEALTQTLEPYGKSLSTYELLPASLGGQRLSMHCDINDFDRFHMAWRFIV